jgi:3-isopropylmalate/(R)-2-methylmalate dehydratase small subunit
LKLTGQTITLKATGQQESLTSTDIRKNNMLNGFDDIDY